MTAGLFVVVTIAWGFSWYAIKLQAGPVPAEVSILWRFALAAAVMWCGLALTGRIRPVRLRQQPWFAAMGLCLFGMNFALFYNASHYVASGVLSLIFTLATVFNAMNQWIFLGKRPSARTLAGSALGICGVALLFGESVLATGANPDAAIGVGLSILGTYVFSLGNLASARATADGADLPNAIAWGMGWGTLLLLAMALGRGQPLIVEWTPAYLGGLAYLSVVASIVAFLTYLSLLKRIGADRAAYATVLFPLIALAVSTVLEGYVWTVSAVVGLPLVLAGNLVIFARLPVCRRAALG